MLSKLIERGPLPLDKALQYAIQMADALRRCSILASRSSPPSVCPRLPAQRSKPSPSRSPGARPCVGILRLHSRPRRLILWERKDDPEGRYGTTLGFGLRAGTLFPAISAVRITAHGDEVAVGGVWRQQAAALLLLVCSRHTQLPTTAFTSALARSSPELPWRSPRGCRPRLRNCRAGQPCGEREFLHRRSRS